jgi:peptide/nickel transport system permease protein
MVFVLIGLSAHPVWIGLIFAYFIGYKLGLTPITGYADFFNPRQEHGGPVQWAYHMILPVDDVRDPLRGALRAHDPGERDGDDERGLRAHRARQGRARAQVMRSHVLRNAMLPIVTMLGMASGSHSEARSSPSRSTALPGSGTSIQALANYDTPDRHGA